MRFFKAIALIAAVLWLAPSAGVATTMKPRILINPHISSNWSGYDAGTSLTNSANNSVSDIKGSWVVPAVKCTLNLTDVSNWIGIDGAFSNSVEQIGTAGDCYAGHPDYYAWYEMFPLNPGTIDAIPVKPGDSISTEVHYDGKSGQNQLFTMSLTNNTTHKSFSQQFSQTQDIANGIGLRNSAEWILEAAFTINVLPLANFGTSTFTGSTATINGVTGPISAFAYEKDDMGSRSTGRLKAQTSALTNGGSAFSVQFISNQ